MGGPPERLTHLAPQPSTGADPALAAEANALGTPATELRGEIEATTGCCPPVPAGRFGTGAAAG